MSHYLIVYKRREGELVTCQRFESSRDALRSRFELERQHRDDPNVEIVVLGADSVETLKRTHGRYFMSTDPLDAVTWVQYQAAFKIAAMALFEITQARELASAQQTAGDALQALRAEVRRFDETEPSWEPSAAAAMLRGQ